CPSISRLVGSGDKVQMQTSKVFAADGRLISELGLERRTVLPLSEIPVAVRQAFIATEDKRFYSHHGIDYVRILGAAKANLISFGYSQGFSTITMQLARNIFPDEISREKKLTRKLKEARVAVEIEHNFPKDTILQLYLNQIDLGAGAHGVEAAAQIYFGKSARQLNVAEAATLAALPKAPAFYNPRTHPERAVRRRNVVLSLMRDQGFLSPEDTELWKAYPLVLTTNRTNYGDVAPYFVEWKYNRATQAIRQPGSTFKPFVYSAAVRAGHPVTEILDDSPLNPPVIQLDSTPWQPKDDDDTTLGMIPMREALYLSRNLATIKLGMSLGQETVIGEARRYGITTPLPAYPSIHIGARGVKPMEMIAAYTAFATLGTRAEPIGILRVEDRQGNILWKSDPRREEVMDPEHTWLMVDMMKDVIRRGTAFSAVWKA